MAAPTNYDALAELDEQTSFAHRVNPPDRRTRSDPGITVTKGKRFEYDTRQGSIPGRNGGSDGSSNSGGH
jgi:hypothetical protein